MRFNILKNGLSINNNKKLTTKGGARNEKSTGISSGSIAGFCSINCM
jgi:hypothetical protein